MRSSQSISEHFYHHRQKFHAHQQSLPPPLLHLPQPQAKSLLSFSKNLPILDISYKRNHAISGLLWMTSFTQLNVSEDYPCCGMCQDLTSFHCQIVFHRVDIPHFIYPCIGCVVSTFWIVWIMLLWTLVCSFCVDVCFHFSWVYTPEWNCWITRQPLCLTFWVTGRSFSKVTIPFYNPPQKFMRVPIFPHPCQMDKTSL